MRGISILNSSRNLVKDKLPLGTANTFKTTVVGAVMQLYCNTVQLNLMCKKPRV